MDATTPLPTPTDVVTWPQAVVALGLIFAVAIWPTLMAYLNTRRTKVAAEQTKAASEETRVVTEHIRSTLLDKNGGSTVKDQLDRIERVLVGQGRRLEGQAQRLEKLEQKLGDGS